MIYPTDLVLIAILNNRRDFEVIRLLGWYRIPLRFAPKIVHADAVAFYQTAGFPSEKWSIRYAARIHGVELVRRAELFQEEADHPRAKEEYYKLQLGPLEALPRPILSRSWKRITFLYTTGDRLLQAKEVGDLSLSGTDRHILWRALRDRGQAPEISEFDISKWADGLEAFLECTKPHEENSEGHETNL
jgi:hypothetical protein